MEESSPRTMPASPPVNEVQFFSCGFLIAAPARVAGANAHKILQACYNTQAPIIFRPASAQIALGSHSALGRILSERLKSRQLPLQLHECSLCLLCSLFHF